MSSLLRLDTVSPTPVPTSVFVSEAPSTMLLQPPIATSIAPSSIQTLTNNLPMPSETASGAASDRQSNDHSLASKVGIAMIPVAVILCLVCVAGFFWIRRRRARRRHPTSDSTLEKEPRPQTSLEFEPRPSTSKVLSMAAFSTPLDKEQSKNRLNTIQGMKSGLNMAATRFGNPDSIQPDLDSPIDRTSPFRLKRGNTIRRCSFESAMTTSWPVPPESVWIKQHRMTEGLHDATSDQENNFAVPQPFESAHQRCHSSRM